MNEKLSLSHKLLLFQTTLSLKLCAIAHAAEKSLQLFLSLHLRIKLFIKSCNKPSKHSSVINPPSVKPWNKCADQIKVLGSNSEYVNNGDKYAKKINPTSCRSWKLVCGIMSVRKSSHPLLLITCYVMQSKVWAHCCFIFLLDSLLFQGCSILHSKFQNVQNNLSNFPWYTCPKNKCIKLFPLHTIY